MATAQVGEIKIHFERRGEGPPLVLLHGIGSGCASWRQLLADFPDRYTLLAWDAPGYGFSSDPVPEVMGIRGYAECLEALLTQQGMEAVYLLGHSWGGVIAQEFYRVAPERVKALILADTNRGNGAESEEVQQQQLELRLKMIRELSPQELARERAPALLSPGVSPEILEEAVRVMGQVRPPGYRSAAFSLAEADHSELLPLIQIPTLLLWGEVDAVTPLSEGKLMENAIPDARLEVIPGIGHLSYLERPERFHQLVDGFLAELREVG